jgi:hypothetical protein
MLLEVFHRLRCRKETILVIAAPNKALRMIPFSEVCNCIPWSHTQAMKTAHDWFRLLMERCINLIGEPLVAVRALNAAVVEHDFDIASACID